MSKYLRKNLPAFTLIELVMVMAIIGILASVAMVSFTDGRIRKDIETNAHEFAAVVREAQNYALTGRQLVSGTTPCFYRITLGGTNYTFDYRYKNAAGACGVSFTVQHTLKSGVTLESDDASLSFTPPFADIFDGNGDPVASGGNVRVEFSKSSKLYAVCIYADGRVLETANATC